MDIKKLLDLHTEMHKYISSEDIIDKKTSSWSIYNHIEHMLLTNSNILDSVLKGGTLDVIEKRSIVGYFVLYFGLIPRGRAKAPKEVTPSGKSQSDLLSLNDQLIRKLKELANSSLDEPYTVVKNHPYFGGLSKKQWLRFLCIHSKHHLRIIEDIRVR